MEMILPAQPLDGFRVGSPGRISIRFDICICHEDLCHAGDHLAEVDLVLLKPTKRSHACAAGAGRGRQMFVCSRDAVLPNHQVGINVARSN